MLSLARRLPRRALARTVNSGWGALAAAGRLHPMAAPARHGVLRLRNVPYRETGRREHRLDIYRPAEGAGPWPVVLYVHGGGFQALSKDSHWLMGLAFARRGYVVFNVSYRLAPAHPFPAAIEDVCAAYAWVVRNARGWGGDLDRLVLAGESAGANLVTSLAVATAFARPEPFAAWAYDAPAHPKAVLAHAGLYQVTDCHRFSRRRDLPRFVGTVLKDVERCYLPERAAAGAPSLALADPVVTLERDEAPTRPLPQFQLTAGTADPLLPDTRRLAAVLQARRVPCETRYYEGEPHAFHALTWRPAARRCWRDMYAFLDRTVG